jgi:site-specific DNA-methyltransferase (adenine-specific)
MANSEIIGAGQESARRAPKINTITCGDCREVMQSIPDKTIDLILCDLPYGTTICKWDTVISFDLLWKEYKRICCGAIVLTGSQPFTTMLIASNINMFKYELIWDKNKGAQPQLANIQPMKSHENILVFGTGKLLYNPQKTKAAPYVRNNKQNHNEHSLSKGLKPIVQVNEGFRYPKSILLFPRDFSAQSRVHPTQKPVALFEYLIRTYTNEGDTVLDNCIGSGTTAIACINTGRNYIGIEKEEKYCRIAEERIHALRSPAQDAMEICHTAPNSAMLQGLKPHAGGTGTSA